MHRCRELKPSWRRFRQILKKIVDTKKEMGKTMRLSAFAMVEAKYAAGDFVPTVFDAVQTVITQTPYKVPLDSRSNHYRCFSAAITLTESPALDTWSCYFFTSKGRVRGLQSHFPKTDACYTNLELTERLSGASPWEVTLQPVLAQQAQSSFP